jgi:hypothetical protein
MADEVKQGDLLLGLARSEGMHRTLTAQNRRLACASSLRYLRCHSRADTSPDRSSLAALMRPLIVRPQLGREVAKTRSHGHEQSLSLNGKGACSQDVDMDASEMRDVVT